MLLLSSRCVECVRVSEAAAAADRLMMMMVHRWILSSTVHTCVWVTHLCVCVTHLCVSACYCCTEQSPVQCVRVSQLLLLIHWWWWFTDEFYLYTPVCVWHTCVWVLDTAALSSEQSPVQCVRVSGNRLSLVSTAVIMVIRCNVIHCNWMSCQWQNDRLIFMFMYIVQSVACH